MEGSNEAHLRLRLDSSAAGPETSAAAAANQASRRPRGALVALTSFASMFGPSPSPLGPSEGFPVPRHKATA